MSLTKDHWPAIREYVDSHPTEPLCFCRMNSGYDPGFFYDNKTGRKPRGMWFCYGSEWFDFLMRTKDYGELRMKIYSKILGLELDMSNFIILKTEQEAISFFEEFSGAWGLINWDKVAQKYSGIFIADYEVIQCPMIIGLSYFHNWDVIGGCVWDLSTVKSVRRVYPREGGA